LRQKRIQAAILRRDLNRFVHESWPIVEPAQDLIWGIHLDAMCLHLAAVAAGLIKKLIISIPPGHAKSLICAVLFPAWLWASRPQWRGLFASYAQDLAIRDSVRSRRLIQSEWYQELFRRNWGIESDQNIKSWFENTERGLRMALGVRGKGTGYRGECTVVDDALSALEAESEKARKRVCEWHDKTYSSRLNDKRHNPQIVVGQRLHAKDLTGHLLSKDAGWVELRLASEYEPDHHCSTPIWSDPRTEEGQLLFPELFPREVIEEIKVELGPRAYRAQHQQRPESKDGNLFHRDWWQFWTVLPDHDELSWVRSIDCNFKKTSDGSYICDQLWAYKGSLRWLVDQLLYRDDFWPMLTRTKSMLDNPLWRLATTTLVERAANGEAVISALHAEIEGIDGPKPTVSKYARAAAATPPVASGQVFLPANAHWTEHFIDEHADFPSAPHDDQVDATSQALTWIRANQYELWSGY
jgi:predicted phage terminase large subunit-like protein